MRLRFVKHREKTPLELVLGPKGSYSRFRRPPIVSLSARRPDRLTIELQDATSISTTISMHIDARRGKCHSCRVRTRSATRSRAGRNLQSQRSVTRPRSQSCHRDTWNPWIAASGFQERQCLVGRDWSGNVVATQDVDASRVGVADAGRRLAFSATRSGPRRRPA